MHSVYVDVCCASLPLTLLEALAAVRAVPGVRVLQTPERLWVRWESDERVLRAVMPLPGVALYAWRDGVWRRVGGRLPAFEVPAGGDYRPLHDILFPAPAAPLPAPSARATGERRLWDKQPMSLVADHLPRATTGLLATIERLVAWSDTVPEARLRKLRGALSGRELLLRGDRLPLLPGAARFWGQCVLRPVGMRVEPDLPEGALRDALGVTADELLVLHGDGHGETIPDAALQPLTRAGLRRAFESLAQEATA